MKSIKEEVIAFLASLDGGSADANELLSHTRQRFNLPHITISSANDHSRKLSEDDKLQLLGLVVFLYNKIPELNNNRANLLKTDKFFNSLDIQIDDRVLAKQISKRPPRG